MTQPSATANSNDQIAQKTFSVGELNRFVKNLLEVHLPLIWVEGEISNFSAPGSGHWYFSLKDEQAQVRCAMFKGRNMRVAFKPKAGSKVRIRARVSLYEGRGEYQIIAEHMEDAGFGLLQQRYEALKLQLANEGLFDESRKKSLPRFAKHIAVITSPTGAAITDVLSVIQRRFPSQRVTIIPTSVQGDAAPQEMIHALNVAQAQNMFDVVLLCRGGGSIEDLWAFNSEKLAREIANCTLPVVNACGHEIDFTISDFVSDLRAPTPSAAAEILTPNKDEIQSTLTSLEEKLHNAQRYIIERKTHQLERLASEVRHPLERLNNLAQRVDYIEVRLAAHIKQVVSAADKKFKTQQNALELRHPKRAIASLAQNILSLEARLETSLQHVLSKKTQRFNAATAMLELASPLATLNRGYAIVKTTEDAVVTDCKQVKKGDTLDIHLAKGNLKARAL